MTTPRRILAYQRPSADGAESLWTLVRRLGLVVAVVFAGVMLWLLVLLIPYMHIDIKFSALCRSSTIGVTTQDQVRQQLSWFRESRGVPPGPWQPERPPGVYACEYKHVISGESFHVYFDAAGRVRGFFPTYE